jgi:hypothetical protein
MRMRARWERQLVLDVGEAVVDQASHKVIDHAVIRLPSILAERYELEPPEERQLMAYDGHRQAKGLGDVANAELVMGQRVHDADSDRVREGLEDLHRLCHRWIRR